LDGTQPRNKRLNLEVFDWPTGDGNPTRGARVLRARVMGHVHIYSVNVLRMVERSSKNRLVLWREGDVLWVGGKEPDVYAIEPVQ